MSIQRVEFRLIQMECCGHLLCWVNPRYPTYCPQCGKFVYNDIRGWVTFKDINATLRIEGLSNVKFRSIAGEKVLPPKLFQE